MQLLQRSMELAPAYKTVPKTLPFQREADFSVLQFAAGATLQDQLETRLLRSGIELQATSELCISPRRDPGAATCVVVDLDLFSLESRVLTCCLASKCWIPLILVGTCDDPRLPIRAIKAGATDFSLSRST